MVFVHWQTLPCHIASVPMTNKCATNIYIMNYTPTPWRTVHICTRKIYMPKCSALTSGGWGHFQWSSNAKQQMMLTCYSIGPTKMIMDDLKEQNLGKFWKKCQQASVHIKQTEPYSLWQNATESAIREPRTKEISQVKDGLCWCSEASLGGLYWVGGMYSVKYCLGYLQASG